MLKNSRKILPLHKTTSHTTLHFKTIYSLYNKQYCGTLYYTTLHHITAYKYKENTSTAIEFLCFDWHKIAMIGLIRYYAFLPYRHLNMKKYSTFGLLESDMVESWKRLRRFTYKSESNCPKVCRKLWLSQICVCIQMK